MNTTLFKTTAIITLTSNFLIAASCSGGACGVAIRPPVPSDLQENIKLKPFAAFNAKQIKKGYDGWIIVDNGGDTDIGENRFMAGIDVNSLLEDNDKVSLFGLISDENLKSGKVSYAYPLPWKDLTVEASYTQTNYTLGENAQGSTGIGTIRSVEGKMTYPIINSDKEKLKFSLSLSNNNIDEEITNDSFVANSWKSSYSATASIDFETKKYSIFNLDTNQELSLGLNSGKLTFDNINDEKADEVTLNTQGSYTKINIDYKNNISTSENTSIVSTFRGQYALNNKNLDDSESLSIGGMNGVKIYEESVTYGSTGFFTNIEGKYKLPVFNEIKNSIGAFMTMDRFGLLNLPVNIQKFKILI